MKERKFDLDRGCLGNGTCVWNKAKEVSGDYENIAHVGEDGKISWRLKNPPAIVIQYVNEIAKKPQWMHN